MTHAYNGIQWIAILVHIIVLFFAIIFHEIFHGYVAYLCGDPTAKNAGRLTLNPLAHIDPFGSVILPAICAILGWPGFGYAKPVPYNPNNLRRRRIDEVLVALAGPLSNLLQAALAAGIYRILIGFIRNNPTWAMSHMDLLAAWIIPILSTIIISNIVLAVFNLIPLPPLDGSKLLLLILPEDARQKFYRIEPYCMIALMALLWFAPEKINAIIDAGVSFFMKLMVG